MRISGRSITVLTGLILASAFLAAALWMGSTTEGARWLLTVLPSLSGTALSVEKIEGRLNDGLHLQGLRLELARQKVEIDTLELRWKPLLLLSGTVALQDLIVSGLRIQDDSAPDNQPPSLVWPRISPNAQLFEIMIARLQLNGISYRRRQEAPLLIDSARGSLAWQDGLLKISDLTLENPAGRASGSVSAGFKQPSLTSDLQVILTRPLAEMDRFWLQTTPARSIGSEQLAGKVTLKGFTGSRTLLELNGQLGLKPDSLNLRQLRLVSPGRKGLLTADGSLAFTNSQPALKLKLQANDLDLAPELKLSTDLSGTLTFTGSIDNYRGDLVLTNRARGWQAISLAAPFQGNRDGLTAPALKGSALAGTLSGNMAMGWRDGFALQTEIRGHNLDPARIDPAWKGTINFTAAGNLARSGAEPLKGSLKAELLQSRLHGQTLTGGLQARFGGKNLIISRLLLQGKGFDLRASGNLEQRLELAARISDFSGLVPGAAGTLNSSGWLTWRAGQLSGSLSGSGSRLAYGGTRAAAADLTARLQPGPDHPFQVIASLRDVTHQNYKLDKLSLEADGTLKRHTLSAGLHSAGTQAQVSLAAGYGPSGWRGQITRLDGTDGVGGWRLTSPAAFSVSSSRFSLSSLALTGSLAEQLEVAADLELQPLKGQVRAQWNGLKLARANPFLQDARLSGSSQGDLRLGFLPGNKLSLTGSAVASGAFSGQGHSISFQRSTINVEGGERGLKVDLSLAASDGGRVRGTFSSAAPFRLAAPDQGQLTAEISGLNLALLQRWLPADTSLTGFVNAQARGNLLPGQRLELTGDARLSGGSLQRSTPDGELKLSFSAAEASWNWRGETLAGVLSLNMAEHGRVRTEFQLPLAARYPTALNRQGPLRGTVQGNVQEKGLVTALFPGLVQESFGEFELDLAIGGSGEAPQIGGKLQLARAGAYLPTAGIHLKDIQLTARLEKDLIRIDSYRAVSGPGHIEGTALINLEGWKVTSYQGTVGGENFQSVFFPELQLSSTPRLTFEGTPQKLSLRGELLLPELKITGAPAGSVISPSSDVVLEGRTTPLAKNSPLALDVRLRLRLGERVFVKTAGIDAQLEGSIDLAFSDFKRITSSGEIKVVKGRYRTYGVNLEIVRGRLFFAGGPINRPALDFLALRTIGDIRAGVTVSGNLQQPITKLYSEPAMPDTDVLAYIVLGHPLGSNGEQTSLLVQAAGALLTSSQAGALQEQIKDQLGLSTLEIQSGVGASNNAMGYKPLPVTAPGSLPAAQQPGLTETVLTVGKYLTPELYISYGKSLFTGNSLFRLRYDISKRWQIETQTGGGASGVDLFYKLEFK